MFLKTIKRTGLGKSLFYSMRFDSKTREENPDFVLNQEPWRSSKILVVTGPNFGCGSSREHAPWALLDFGIRCVIATSYADIFFNNTFKNGMLPMILPQADVDVLAADAASGAELEVDLPNQVVRRPNGEEVKFDVDPFRKHCLVNGLDDIGLTEQKEEKIKEYEARRTRVWSWLDGIGHDGNRRIPVDGAPAAKDDASGQPPEKKQKIDW